MSSAMKLLNRFRRTHLATEDSIFGVVVGTAGHIDHGKSSLVRRLTGIDPDRLPEEKDRGLTIDLGFAPMKLPGGELVGIIDVPGHEKFIRNMVAGASGIDLVVLVVAADDSVMPQTLEHLAIMTLLGVERGVIAINKIDLVDSEMLELVEEEIRETVQGTFLEDAPMLRVSAETGDGIDALRDEVIGIIGELPSRDTEGVFRLPIQRVFSSKGHGTVITGVPVSGAVAKDDRLEILPGEHQGRVRGLQAYKVTVDRARAGHSTAINLADVNYKDLSRGMVAATPGYFTATEMLEVSLRSLSGLSQPLTHRMPIRFLQGTTEAVGRLYLLDCTSLEPGEEAVAQIRLEEPVVVAPGDRFVLRQTSPMITLGGGEILDRSRWRLKTGKDFVVESVRRKMTALDSPQDYLRSLLQDALLEIHTTEELSRRMTVTQEQVAEYLEELASAGEVTSLQGGRWLVQEGMRMAGERITGAIETVFRQDPYRVSVKALEIRDALRLEDGFLEAVYESLVAEGRLDRLRGGRLSIPDFEPPIPEAERAVLEKYRNYLAGNLFEAGRNEDLAPEFGTTEALLSKLQSLLVDRGELVRLTPDVVLLEEAILEAVRRLAAHHETSGPFSASEAKDLLGTTRKFAIPLLEHLDKQGWTRRREDRREVNHEKLAELS
ncbi:MAG: selenocysteine-specific translation elongation factor [Planctomycetia bacterium TMED53]|nr:MAG: selenocysteine-specific translation elongation factor [Planctomycetia bacterium TMED53]